MPTSRARSSNSRPPDPPDLQAEISALNPAALFADGFETALVGWLVRPGHPVVAVYDRARMLAHLAATEGLTGADAEEHLDFNVAGAWMGPSTPLYIEFPVEA